MLKKEEVKMEASNLCSTDKILLHLEKYKPIFKVQSFFELISKRQNLQGVPFSVTINMKNMHLECKNMRQQKLTRHDGYAYYCVYPDYIDEYAVTGAKLISCKNCPFNNL